MVARKRRKQRKFTDRPVYFVVRRGHLIARYWPQLTVEQITDMAELMPQSEGA